MKKIFMGICLLGLTSAAMGQEPAGFMVGGGVALDRGDFGDQLEDELQALVGPGVTTDDDGFDTGADVYIGFAFGAASSLRVGYRKFGDQTGDIDVSGFGFGKYSVEADGAYLAADLLFPLSEQFFIGGTLGVQNWDGDITLSAPGVRDRFSDDGRDVFFGLRSKYLINEGRAALVGNYNRYSFEVDGGDDLKYGSIQLGLEAYFY
ncbi:MAG: outer membrane beta-barrel protein [Pseudomonadota bacterium]|nr:outer membrane beta-barrel protein [Pseudomonadota bacterium]